MRILLITPYFYPHKGGSQHYAESIYTLLMKDNPTISVDVLTYNTDKQALVETYKGFTIYRVPCLEVLKGQFAIPNYFVLLKTLDALFKKNRYSLINSHTRFFENSWWAPFVAKHYHVKSLLTDHCASHPTHRSNLISKIAYFADKVALKTIVNSYDHVSAVSLSTKKFLESNGIKNVELIYGGITSSYFKPVRPSKHRIIPKIEKPFAKNDIVISFVGRMIPSKGPEVLLQAAQTITQKKKNVYFIFAGGGLLSPELEKKKDKRIFFTGELEKKEVKNLLSKTDIFVHPSMHHEGFPMALLEAGASGCAIIATDCGGTKEIIEHGKTGIIARPTVKSLTHNILDLIESKKKRAKLGENARFSIKEKYEWNRIVGTYKRFLLKITSNPYFISSINPSRS